MTGVQTCALPISVVPPATVPAPPVGDRVAPAAVAEAPAPDPRPEEPAAATVAAAAPASELATGEVPAVTSEGPPAAVEELFARIRAGRPPVGPAAPPAVDATPAAPPRPAPPVDAVAGEQALEGRDDLLDNLEAGLTRALKRVLSDEQNEVLDGLRRMGAAAGADALPEPGAQAVTYREAAAPWLVQAARAGVGFVADPGAGPPAEVAQSVLVVQADTLARELVGPLRDRLTRAAAGTADADDPAAVAEAFRAAYRQWKVQQVEECARHHVVAAFSAGAFAATPEVATLQWLVDDEGHCPDCDDNALAGPTAKGEPFPTGQLHPPAHPGCRCLLLPVT